MAKAKWKLQLTHDASFEDVEEIVAALRDSNYDNYTKLGKELVIALLDDLADDGKFAKVVADRLGVVFLSEMEANEYKTLKKSAGKKPNKTVSAEA